MVHRCEIQGSGDMRGGKPNVKTTAVGRKGYLSGRPTAKEHESGESMVRFPRTIDDLLLFYPCCPPEQCVRIPEFFDNPYLNFMAKNCKKIEIAIQNWTARLAYWSIFDYNSYYSDPRVKPYFNNYGRQLISLYYSVESVKIANKLLLHQFNDDDESVRNFLQVLKTVVDSNVVRKMNTIAIIAPPSSDKTYFFDAVCSFFLNYGAYGTANKTNNFCWADGAGKKFYGTNQTTNNSVWIK